MADARPTRRAARIILLDPADRVLLIRFHVERQGRPFAFWATPGGAVEDGEDDVTAVRRELREELGLDLAVEGPVHLTQEVFEYDGVITESTDVFFVARCGANAPVLSGVTEIERAAMREIVWWSTEELEQTADAVFPDGLASIIRDAARPTS